MVGGSLADLVADAASARSMGTDASGEASQFHYPPRLDEVVLLVHDDDAIGIHEAVRDDANNRRYGRFEMIRWSKH